MSRKVAICFFGITRSLSHTRASIEAHVLAPARQLSSPKIYAHFFLQKEIDNPRSGEKGILDYEEYRLLPSDWLKLEEPDHCLAQWNFEGLKAWGDSWQDEFRSLRNLIHQLHSLHTVTEAALADGTEVCLFCRPDLRHRRTPIRHQPGKPSRKLEFQTVQFPGGRAGEPGAVQFKPHVIRQPRRVCG